jgi:hypothetical protein
MTESISEGARVCCVGRDGAKMARLHFGAFAPIYTGAVYEARRRVRDGVLTWRRIGSYGGTRSSLHGPSETYLEELYASAPYRWLKVRHGDRATEE